MKRFVALCLAALLLCGCKASDDQLDQFLDFRDQLQSKSIGFDALITADYGEQIHQFKLNCVFGPEGNMKFSVTEPDSIAEISGNIVDGNGELTFDDVVLAFEMLADGQISPVSAPWVIIRAIRGGYVYGCGECDSGFIVILDDSYREETLRVEAVFDPECVPKSAEILWQGRRILTLEIQNFGWL